ncbi:MAG TPA: sodium/glutamate symporter [Gemmatimonadales bacterium]|jgi:ESS family glutamate:Na+ symporter|nr:sodium/glutamate symporter [Gemmatimonadales bacterium]
MTELKLDLLQTLTLAALVYFAGIQLRRRVRWLDRLNIPAAVVGGLLFTLLVLVLRRWDISLQLDTAMQATLSVAFFTSIGMGASLALLRAGGIQVLIFLVLATLFCLVQNFLGIAIALGFEENPLLGVMAGSVTLVGGPATGLAFAPVFEEAGLRGAGPLALTAATAGIVCGGLVGGPVGTRLINRFSLKSPSKAGADARREAEAELRDEPELMVVEVEREDSEFVRNLVVLALAMAVGSIVSAQIQSLGITLPAYIGAMLVASVLRNVDDATRWLRIDQRAMEFAGNLALNIFLVVALMTLKLWELASLALPLLAILVAQVLVVVLFALTISFRVMGKDYESAVMSSGFIGFVLGTTANAVANMRALVARFGPAPRAFLVVPLVGAFFIDFTNAIIITVFVNWLK